MFNKKIFFKNYKSNDYLNLIINITHDNSERGIELYNSYQTYILDTDTIYNGEQNIKLKLTDNKVSFIINYDFIDNYIVNSRKYECVCTNCNILKVDHLAYGDISYSVENITSLEQDHCFIQKFTIEKINSNPSIEFLIYFYEWNDITHPSPCPL